MSQFQSAHWTDSSETLVEAVRASGETVFVPADPANRDYQMLVEGEAAEGDRPAIAPVAILAPASSE